jgi:hypothetical protein
MIDVINTIRMLTNVNIIILTAKKTTFVAIFVGGMPPTYVVSGANNMLVQRVLDNHLYLLKIHKNRTNGCVSFRLVVCWWVLR